MKKREETRRGYQRIKGMERIENVCGIRCHKVFPYERRKGKRVIQPMYKVKEKRLRRELIFTTKRRLKWKRKKGQSPKKKKRGT